MVRFHPRPPAFAHDLVRRLSRRSDVVAKADIQLPPTSYELRLGEPRYAPSPQSRRRTSSGSTLPAARYCLSREQATLRNPYSLSLVTRGSGPWFRAAPCRTSPRIRRKARVSGRTTVRGERNARRVQGNAPKISRHAPESRCHASKVACHVPKVPSNVVMDGPRTRFHAASGGRPPWTGLLSCPQPTEWTSFQSGGRWRGGPSFRSLTSGTPRPA